MRSAGTPSNLLISGGPFWCFTRDDAIEHLNEIIVVPVACALKFDHVSLAQRNRICPVLCALMETRWAEVRTALLIACGFKATGS